MPVISPLLIGTMRRVGALLQAGDFQAAHGQLETIVEANSGYVEALRLLAGTKQALGDAAAAEGLLRQALALEPGWSPAMAMLGELLLGSGRVLEAEPLLQRAATGAHADTRAALVLARHFNDTQRPAQALELAGPLCVAGKADAELVAQHVAALAALGRREEAVSLYRLRVAASPGDLTAAQSLAVALEGANQHEEAACVARQTLSLGHRTAALYHTYARCLRALGAHEHAEAALRDCLAMEPRLVEAHSNLAQLIWMRTGDITQATAVLDQALQRFAGEDALWAAKAAILQAAGDARAAYACLAQQAARPRAATNLLVRAGLAALEFDSAVALALAERAVGTTPTSVPARTLLVAAQLGVGDARGALTHCQALLAHAPDDQYLIALQTTAWRLLQDERYAQLCDYRQLVVSGQLEAPEPWPDLASFLVDLRASLDRLHDPHGYPLLFQSLRHGTETSQDLLRSADPVIQALFRSFAAPIGRYVERVGRGSDPLRRRNGGNWRFNGSWSVRLRRSGYHANHVHPRGWISSAFYLQLPDSMTNASNQEGSLSFGEPGIATTPPLRAEFALRPEVGMLVLFPSYFWHGTLPFAGDQARLTVAFDVVPDG
jgi:tetratricopeptide (TPR) repeat protein